MYKFDGNKFDNDREKDAFETIKTKINSLKNKHSVKELLPNNVFKVSMNIQKNLVNQIKESFWGTYYLDIRDEFWEIRTDWNDEKTKDMRLTLRYFDSKENFDEYVNTIRNKIHEH